MQRSDPQGERPAMSASQHTPGPWHLRGDTILVKPSCIIGQCDRGGKHPETIMANARLIAAAPELLQALKHCLCYLEADSDDPDEYATFNEAYAAVKKATRGTAKLLSEVQS